VFRRSNSFIGNVLPESKSLIKNITICLSLATAVTVGANSVAAEDSLTTVYHVYLDSEYMGSVNDQTVIDDVTKTKITNKNKTYEDLRLTVEDLEIIPEKMFRPVYNNDLTVSKLMQELDVVVEATELTLNGEPIAYFKDNEDAQAVLEQYKQLYIPESDLVEWNDIQSNTSEELPALKENESRLLDVSLTEKVSLEEEKVSPKKILTVEQGVDLLKKGTLADAKYEIEEQDVLGSIAKKHDLTLKQLLELNPGMSEDTLIKPGDLLNVTVFKPYTKVKVTEEELKKESIAFETEIKEDSTLPKGEKKTTQEGQNGEKLIHYVIEKENGTEISRTTKEENVVKEPVKEVIVKGTKVIPSRGTGSLAWPAVGGYVSSHLGQRWGKLHKGIDIARPSDRTIKAADNGTVVSAGYDGGYGNKVVINHNNGIKTVYAHLDSISVTVGQVVSQGQKIGVMGKTGNSTGVHLHFEVYENGNLKNPMDYL